jgi:hypothetical protein
MDIAINIEGCESGEEAIERVKLCVKNVRIPSIKPMRIIDVSHCKSIPLGIGATKLWEARRRERVNEQR